MTEEDKLIWFNFLRRGSKLAPRVKAYDRSISDMVAQSEYEHCLIIEQLKHQVRQRLMALRVGDVD